jgi:hypothetical protein
MGFGRGAPTLKPGEYTVRLTVDNKTYTQSVTLMPDPRNLPKVPEPAAAVSPTQSAADRNSLIHTEDVYLFYKIYDAAGGHPTVDQLQHDYIDKGSDAVRELEKIRNTTAQRIADAIAKRPEIYENARRCMALLPNVRARFIEDLGKFRTFYPQMKDRPVSIVVGRGRPVGVTSSTDGFIVIGLEALCGPDMNPDPETFFVRVLVHEYAHLQQPPATDDDPHPTVLEAAIVEGGAEFAAELFSGDIANARLQSWTKGREKEIETQFVPDEDSKDLSKWFYNRTDPETGLAKPGWQSDLGYWVGYRIVKSYYEHASDKRAAFREILETTDPHAILAKSGWHPGIVLD